MRLAITISRGVSLGNYEGGVLLEVAERLKEKNSTDPKDKITVDVISRLSTGEKTAVTAAEVALKKLSTCEQLYIHNRLRACGGSRLPLSAGHRFRVGGLGSAFI
jgi:hypothetical protein